MLASRDRRTIQLTAVVIVVILISGCHQQPKVARPDADWSLRHVLPLADQIDIARLNDGVEYPFTTLAAGSNPKMFALLKQSKRFHAKPPQMKPDFVFNVPLGDGKVYFSYSGPSSFPTYGYVSQTGELGMGNDWCYVPEQFKAWMLALIAKTPARHFRVTHPGEVTVVEPLPVKHSAH